MKTIIRNIYNVAIYIMTYLMKLAVIISLPFVFIYYMCHPRKTANKR